MNRELVELWIAIALMDLEPRMKRIRNYRKLHKLREAIKKELRLNETMAA